MTRKMLRDQDWEIIRPLLPTQKGKQGRPRKDDRLMIEAILWVVRTGAPWRDLPPDFGSWKSVYTRFRTWTRFGVWEILWNVLKKNADHESHILDSTTTKVHQHAMGGIGGKVVHAIGKTRGGWNTKIHAVVDALGHPIDVLITEGQLHDSVPAKGLIKGKTSENVIADKAYDTNDFRKAIQEELKQAVIPACGTRIERVYYDKHLIQRAASCGVFFSTY